MLVYQQVFVALPCGDRPLFFERGRECAIAMSYPYFTCVPMCPLVNSHSDGKSPALRSKSSVNRPVSIAMFVYQRVCTLFDFIPQLYTDRLKAVSNGCCWQFPHILGSQFSLWLKQRGDTDDQMDTEPTAWDVKTNAGWWFRTCLIFSIYLA